MNQQIKICQNCKTNFEITPDDFSFYEKINVPPPTFCPECRRQRRFVWRNERTLYKRSCDLCHKNIIAMYSPDSTFPVYCRECWYGDAWDPISFGREYDMSRPFFEQFQELSAVVPKLALWQRNVVNSEYSNMTAESRNAYLSVSVVKDSENVFYSKFVDKSRDIVDSFNTINGSEGLYENVDAQTNYNSQYLFLSRNCIDSYYLIDCVNCSNCFMSYNLRNKKFCIRNVQYTQEEYQKEMSKISLGLRSVRTVLFEEFNQMRYLAVYRYANNIKAMDSTGNDLSNVKNCVECFDVYNSENVKCGYRAFDLKDCMDFDYGGKSELNYEYTTGAQDNYNVKFSYSAMSAIRNVDYTESCRDSSNLFGCISVHGKEYVILNKVYPKDEYLKLREEIIKQMTTVPYVDKVGIKYEYGEFFPVSVAPFAYNETIAQEFKPLTEGEASAKGYKWRLGDKKNFEVTIPHDDIPIDIEKVGEDILEEVLGCAHSGNCSQQCSTAFRLTDYELKFYKKHQIPLPTLCPNCRYYERLKFRNPLKLWHRKCMKEGCTNEFETSYAPGRPEKVYCERCYQQEVY